MKRKIMESWMYFIFSGLIMSLSKMWLLPLRMKGQRCWKMYKNQLMTAQKKTSLYIISNIFSYLKFMKSDLS